MKILTHSESHIVGLEDGSEWQIYPADLDLTLNWLPTTDLEVVKATDKIGSHELVDKAEGTRVRVLSAGRNWPVGDVKSNLRDGK
jgi:hypothetical protein